MYSRLEIGQQTILSIAIFYNLGNAEKIEGRKYRLSFRMTSPDQLGSFKIKDNHWTK